MKRKRDDAEQCDSCSKLLCKGEDFITFYEENPKNKVDSNEIEFINGHVHMIKYLEPFITRGYIYYYLFLYACEKKYSNIIKYLFRENQGNIFNGDPFSILYDTGNSDIIPPLIRSLRTDRLIGYVSILCGKMVDKNDLVGLKIIYRIIKQQYPNNLLFYEYNGLKRSLITMKWDFIHFFLRNGKTHKDIWKMLSCPYTSWQFPNKKQLANIFFSISTKSDFLFTDWHFTEEKHFLFHCIYNNAFSMFKWFLKRVEIPDGLFEFCLEYRRGQEFEYYLLKKYLAPTWENKPSI
jgi:hypothetical protein